MPELLSVLSVGLGTLLAIVAAAVVLFWFIEDITQKKHAVLRNYPVIGRLRYFFEKQGEYFRQYFFAGDREEMPFNRATRAWVYRVAKQEGGSGIIGFGSTYDMKAPGAILFVNAPFPVWMWMMIICTEKLAGSGIDQGSSSSELTETAKVTRSPFCVTSTLVRSKEPGL